MSEKVISVRVQARASRDGVEEYEDGSLRVRTTASPTDGKANKAVVKLLAKHFGVAKSCIELTHGMKSRDKRFRVSGAPGR